MPAGEAGWLWVPGGSRTIAYWQQMDKTMQGFHGEWCISGDLIRMDAGGYVTYAGRSDEMLKVGGRWLAPQEVVFLDTLPRTHLGKVDRGKLRRRQD